MIPGNDLKYSKDHEWVRVDGDIAIIGITNYAQLQLGDIVYVELPEIGVMVERDEVVCAVESVKTAADIITPISGEVVDANGDLDDGPELINDDPFTAWIMKIQISDMSEIDNLMDEAEYADFCENEG